MKSLIVLLVVLLSPIIGRAQHTLKIPVPAGSHAQIPVDCIDKAGLPAVPKTFTWFMYYGTPEKRLTADLSCPTGCSGFPAASFFLDLTPDMTATMGKGETEHHTIQAIASYPSNCTLGVDCKWSTGSVDVPILRQFIVVGGPTPVGPLPAPTVTRTPTP